MDKLQATVIIWGNDNYNVLGLLRQLTPFVDEVIFLANYKANGCASKSKYCKNLRVAKTKEKALVFFRNKCGKFKNKAYIITTSDLLAEFVDQHSEELSKNYVLSTTSEQGVLARALNKDYQYKIAQKVGIDVPLSRIFRFDSTIENITYPCLLKPAFKKKGVHHPFKTCVCNNQDELVIAQQRLDKCGTYILQQYIEKEKDLLIYGCRFSKDQVVYAGCFSKSRWSGGDGSYGKLESAIPENIKLDMINAFLNEIEYYGLFSAEFGVQNGKAWFYEFNLRNDGTSHYFYQASMTNLPLSWVQYHIEGAVITPDSNFSATFIDEIGDYDNVRQGLVSKSEWKHQKKEATVYKYYDSSDKLPYYYMQIRGKISELYHKILK